MAASHCGEGLWFSRLTQLSSRYHLRDNLFKQEPIRLWLPMSGRPPPPKLCQAFDDTPCPLWGSAIITGDRQQRGVGHSLPAAWLSGATSDVGWPGHVSGKMEFLLIQPIWNGLPGWRFDLFSFCSSHRMEGGRGTCFLASHWIMHSTTRFLPPLGNVWRAGPSEVRRLAQDRRAQEEGERQPLSLETHTILGTFISNVLNNTKTLIFTGIGHTNAFQTWVRAGPLTLHSVFSATSCEEVSLE